MQLVKTIIAALAVPAASLTLASPKAPSANVVCSVAAQPVYNLAALGDDVSLDGNSSLGHVKDEPATTAEKKDELNDAIGHYKTQKMQFQLAEARLMKAFDSLLEVPTASGQQLTTLLEGGGKPTLVVFYAPWCPHCQTFVLHDGKGDPVDAPLEQMRRDFKGNNDFKEVDILRFDVAKHGKDIPSDFKVEGIPTVYFVNHKGKAEHYMEDPHDVGLLKSFITGHM